MSGRFGTPWFERPNAPCPGTRLCGLYDVTETSGKGVRFGDGKQAFEMFLVRRGRAVAGYVNQCPHFKVVLNARPDSFINSEGVIMCAWHYARFRPEDGYCFDGPCEGMSLVGVPVGVEGDTVRIGSPGTGARDDGSGY